ncbi:MAG: hypothetical protein WC124_15230 [Desulfoplanes sp.]|nr:hypothetical protein [Desulfoplanes sp.]
MQGIVLMLLGSMLMLVTGCVRQPVSPDAGLSPRMEKPHAPVARLVKNRFPQLLPTR